MTGRIFRLIIKGRKESGIITHVRGYVSHSLHYGMNYRGYHLSHPAAPMLIIFLSLSLFLLPLLQWLSEESANKNNYNDEHEASTLQLFLFALYLLCE